jgi:hypothetical protein
MSSARSKDFIRRSSQKQRYIISQRGYWLKINGPRRLRPITSRVIQQISYQDQWIYLANKGSGNKLLQKTVQDRRLRRLWKLWPQRKQRSMS